MVAREEHERFELRQHVTSTAMSEVWRARDRVTGRDVALKLIAVTTNADRDRFVREHVLLAGITHPGIVGYVAHGTTERGDAWLAMEWVEGETLQARLAQRELTVIESVRLVAAIAHALGVAHARGIVHRDVKPGNVMLTEHGPKLLDFGIARHGLGDRVTATGALIGTPGYMAPEQARGELVIDARADVFALGCVLYRCLAHRPAFPGDAIVNVLVDLAAGRYEPLDRVRPGLPGPLLALVARMLDRDPARRPLDAREVAAALDALEPALPRHELPLATAVLGEDEQRLVSVVLASITRAASRRAVVAALRPLGVEPEWLSDHVLVTLRGTSTATDLAARAARCALVLQAVLPESPIAIATGRAVFAASTLLGEARDRAEALLRDTRGATVAIDDATAGLLDARFEVAKHEAGLELRAMRDVARPDEGRALGTRLPFAGRERELAMIDATLDECIEARVARVVLVTGPPGVGKSRLAAELVMRVEARGDVAVVPARADSVGRRSAWQLAARIARRVLGIDAAQDVTAQRERIAEWAARAMPEPDRARTATFLAELVGARIPDDAGDALLAAARQDPMRMGDQLRRAFQDLLAASCDRGPLMLVLEDLHWADLPSIRLLDGALRALAERPVLVLGLARPEVHEQFPALWAERGASQLRLGELGRRTCERLARSVLGDDAPAALVARVVERCAGNALFLEEILRRVAQQPGEDALPESVLAMLQVRLESLSGPARRLARAASVFGRDAPLAGVIALLGTTDPIDDALRELVEHEVLEQRGTGFARDRELSFRHELVREAAYDMLTDEDRSLGHRLAAAWLERSGAHDATLLAEHLQRGSEPTLAIVWLERAGEQALEGGDFEGAVEHARRALALGAAERVGSIAMIEVEALAWSGRFAELHDAARAVMSGAPPGSPLWSRAASALLFAGSALPIARAAEIIGQIITAELPDDARSVQVRAHAIAAIVLYRAGQIAIADPILARLARIDDPERDPGTLAWIELVRVYRARFGDGDPAAARAHAERAARHAERAGDAGALGLARIDVAYSSLGLGLVDEALDAARLAVDAGETHGAGFLVAYARGVLGLALARRGRLAEARAELEGCIVRADAAGDGVNQGFARNLLATVALAEGDAQRARRLADEALAAPIPPTTRAYAAATASSAALACGDVDAACNLADDAWRSLALTGAPEIAHGVIARARITALVARGDHDAARAALTEARARLATRAARIDDPHWRAAFDALPEHAWLSSDDVA
ncbi:Adenylate cyclase [Sandaracinus amylolyticus]|uniref:Adenylate cyclase n=1 Tax=Sandaracinus amylolyticus TaxID=927083 RepID=A0A0F6W4Y7_9BACT|nr:Adenylate cyclase [Sandaracinus amylolyticus]